jgi:acetyl-CoA acetyltransferase
MTSPVRGTVAIVGAAETTRLGVIPDMSAIELHADAARNAIADAGLTNADIDGVACAGQSPVAMAHYLGITPRYLDGTTVGGCSFMLHVRHAVAAIAAGMCDTVLVTHGESGKSRVGAGGGWRGGDASSLQAQFEAPYGPTGAPSTFPIGVLRYMKTYGLTHEQLAMVAVVQRQWASQNPRAMMRDLITVDDVLSSRVVAYPMHLLECCLVTDGGGALVLTSASRAKDLPQRPVFVLGTGESSETPMISQMEDFTTSKAFRISGAKAFAEAGIAHEDVDHVMIYDAFAHLPIYGLEALGFVGPGEAGAFIEEGNTAPGGGLPLNTNGGGLSYTHTGMYGMFAIQESVRQLRGTAPAQVPDAKISVAQGVGGMFAAAGTLVLTNEAV